VKVTLVAGALPVRLVAKGSKAEGVGQQRPYKFTLKAVKDLGLMDSSIFDQRNFQLDHASGIGGKLGLPDDVLVEHEPALQHQPYGAITIYVTEKRQLFWELWRAVIGLGWLVFPQLQHASVQHVHLAYHAAGLATASRLPV
jgi:hypothetical protein